jgi:hypothetical protein
VAFSEVPCQTVSLIGLQDGRFFKPYRSADGAPIVLIAPGAEAAAALFHQGSVDNTRRLWLTRLGALVLFFVAFLLISAPVLVASGYVPVVGTVLGGVDALVCFGLAVAATVFTIGYAWMHVHPLAASLLSGAAVVVLILSIARHRKSSRALAAPR